MLLATYLCLHKSVSLRGFQPMIRHITSSKRNPFPSWLKSRRFSASCYFCEYIPAILPCQACFLADISVTVLSKGGLSEHVCQSEIILLALPHACEVECCSKM